MTLANAGLSRRSFLVSLGGATVGVLIGGSVRDAQSATIAGEMSPGIAPNVWVTLAEDGTVTVVSPSSEMGQGVMTSSALILAEELDADWSLVRVVQAPADSAYGNPEFGGIQMTGGSVSTTGYYTPLRLAGAQARRMLLGGAAQLLNCTESELSTEPHRVMHAASGRGLDYAEILRRARFPETLPDISEADLKSQSRFRYLGTTDIPRIDVPAKTNGSAVFGIDVQLPDMLYGVVLRPPVQGETPEEIDDTAAREVPRLLGVTALPYGVGVVAETYEAALRARDALQVTWSRTSPARDYSTDAIQEDFRAIAASNDRSGITVRDEGSTDAGIAEAAHVLTASYMADHVYHATMEPMTATARVSRDHAEIWAPSQAQTLAVSVASDILGIDTANIRMTTTLLGGGFGRKAEADFISDAVHLARHTEGRPVKVIWTREDDVRNCQYRPLVAQHMEVGLTAEGRISGWRQRVVGESIYARFDPEGFAEEGGMDDTIYGEVLDNNYRLAHQKVEFLRQQRGVAVGFWRGTAEGYVKFFFESMVDEVAAQAGIDPLSLRLNMLEHDPRAQQILRSVARIAEWDRPREGRGLGLAYSEIYGAHCAEVAEVTLDRETGEIRVHDIWCAIDPGIALQPKNIEAQMIGGIAFGLGAALYEQINIVGGEVQESNFDTYRVPRMSDMPRIHVHIESNPESPPYGVGEASTPPVAPAIANAVAQLTGGTRLRHLPFLPSRVMDALGA